LAFFSPIVYAVVSTNRKGTKMKTYMLMSQLDAGTQAWIQALAQTLLNIGHPQEAVVRIGAKFYQDGPDFGLKYTGLEGPFFEAELGESFWNGEYYFLRDIILYRN
jgi:hypothetical protein